MDNRDFKGVWIPREVWLDERLSALDKIILTEIDSLDGERGCYASNKRLADFCQCSESKISKSISLLIELNYIYVESFDGRKRILRSRLSKNNNQTSKNYDAGEQKKRHINTNINTTINTNKINNNDQPAKPSDQELLNEFEDLWHTYPRKQGKAKALEAYKRARKAGVDKTTVLDGITRYNAQIKANKTKAKYIMQGSTWFNGKRWEDEYTDQPKAQPKTKQEQIDDDYLKYLESLG